VPVELVPKCTDRGEKDSPSSFAAAVTVNVAETATPFRVAVIATLASAETANVVIVKLAELKPAETFTLEGTDATVGSELVNVAVPPTVSFSVTVPVTVPPPFTLNPLRVSETGNSVTPVRVVATRSPRPSWL